jgi:hypothetical protein
LQWSLGSVEHVWVEYHVAESSYSPTSWTFYTATYFTLKPPSHKKMPMTYAMSIAQEAAQTDISVYDPYEPETHAVRLLWYRIFYIFI